METKQQVPVTNEIASVIWAKKCAEDKGFLAEIKADPAAKAFAGKAPSMQVCTVQNTSDTLNLCVPDYKMLNDGTLELADEAMADVSGGFIWMLSLLAVPAAVTGAGAVGAAAVAAGVGVGIAAGVGAFNEDTGLYDVSDAG